MWVIRRQDRKLGWILILMTNPTPMSSHPSPNILWKGCRWFPEPVPEVLSLFSAIAVKYTQRFGWTNSLKFVLDWIMRTRRI
jgi:hypothetical protein